MMATLPVEIVRSIIKWKFAQVTHVKLSAGGYIFGNQSTHCDNLSRNMVELACLHC